MSYEAFKSAVDRAGSQTKFADGVGMSQQLVSYYLRHEKPLPAEYVLAAEAAGFGSRHELRPDIYPPDVGPPRPFRVTEAQAA